MRFVVVLTTTLAMLLSASGSEAAIATRSFALTASQFPSFSNEPSPIGSLSATFALTYDDTLTGFQGTPANFTAVTNAGTNVGPFSAAPIVGYFPASAISSFPRLGIGGAIGGGNVLASGADDFYFTFDASAAGPTPAMLGFIVKGNKTGFLAVDAVVTPIAAAPVPEPATWAMFIGGFGLIGTGLRRRNTRTLIAEA